MTDVQAKAIGVQSARRGRKRAKDLVVRVVSYFFDSYTVKKAMLPTSALKTDVRKALLDVNHPARDYSQIDAFVERTLSESVLDREMHRYVINYDRQAG